MPVPKDKDTVRILGIKPEDLLDCQAVEVVDNSHHIEYKNIATGSKVRISMKDDNGVSKNIYINGKKLS